MIPPLTLSVAEPWTTVAVGERVQLRLRLECPLGGARRVVIPAGGVSHASAELTNDLHTEDIALAPGERAGLTVGVRFTRPGDYSLSGFAVQVGEEGSDKGDLVPLPPHPFRVVPSLAASLLVSLERVCGYDAGVKVEVAARNVGPDDLADVRLALSPAEAVLAGPLLKRLPRLRPGDEVRFDVVTPAASVGVEASADAPGGRASHRYELPVPEGEVADARPAFAFLEPRVFSSDRVALAPEGGGGEIAPERGVLPVHGGKSRYVLTVVPSHPDAIAVNLYAKPGEVEVTPQAAAGRRRPFLLTVVEDGLFTKAVRLEYDVRVRSGGRESTQRGEVYLSVRPTAGRAWKFAATLGVMVTLKGAAGLVGALAKPEFAPDDVFDLLRNPSEGTLDLLMLSSIPLSRGVLWLADRAWRPFQEG